MKISIIGAGNIGGAIACGLAESGNVLPENITIIDRSGKNLSRLLSFNDKLNAVISDYSSLSSADVIIIAVKPWMVADVLKTHKDLLSRTDQLIVSVAAEVTLSQLEASTSTAHPIFRVVPNTAIAVRQSMTYIASLNANEQQRMQVCRLFAELGKSELIDEKLIPALTSLTSCGIAFAFRYIRAAMEGGVEIGIYPEQAKSAVLQTLKGAIELLDANGTHPEVEIDKVTTAGGITIKGLNEMEHAGFTSAVIKGLKASNVK